MKSSARNHRKSARVKFRGSILPNVHTVAKISQANRSDPTFKNARSISSIQTNVTPAENSLLFQRMSHVTKKQDHVRRHHLQYERLLAHVERITLERIISYVIPTINTMTGSSEDDKTPYCSG